MNTLRLFLSMLMISASTMVMAQEQTDGKQKRSPEQRMEMMWRGMSQKLMLSDAQSEKVKPMYLAYVKEMKEVTPKHIKTPTEADIKAEMKQQFANERKQLDIQEKYFDKFAKELNARQAKSLVQAGNMRMAGHGMRGGMRGGMHKGQFNRGHMGGQRGMHGFGPQMQGKGNKPGANS